MADKYRFVIAGAGGVGSWLAEGLVRMLQYKAPGSALVIVDGDNYEAKNKERQNFQGLGNKAEVLAAKIDPDFEDTYVIPLASWIVSDDAEVPEPEEGDEPTAGVIKASKLLCEDDVIYAVVDNFKCRRIIVDAAMKLDNIDVFLGGNDDALFGSSYHYRRRNGKDITVNPIDNHPELADPPDRNPGEMSCQERLEIDGGTQFIAANFGVVAYLLGETQTKIFEDSNIEASQKYWDLGLGLGQAFDRRVDQESDTVATV